MTELSILKSHDDFSPPPIDGGSPDAPEVVADGSHEMHRASTSEIADEAPVSAASAADATAANVTDSGESDAVAPAGAMPHGLPPDQAYVGTLYLTLEENWNCSSLTLTEPLIAQNIPLFSDLERIAGEARDAEQRNLKELETEEIEPIGGLTEGEADVVERLAEWLIEVRAAADEVAGLANADTETDPDIDGDDDRTSPGLFRLVEEFTALRQDVKLQAKSARGLQDQAKSLVECMNRAIEQFQSVTPREHQAVRDAIKPLLESLTDLDASLDRGRLAAETAQARWLDEQSDQWRDLVEAELQVLPTWKRWCLRAVSAKLATNLHARFAESWSASQDAQVEGYRLVQNRLRRLLQQHHVERIETVGQLTDPNVMTVVDVADHEHLPAGTVLEELRPGYLWRGQLLRYAEVRVVRSRGET